MLRFGVFSLWTPLSTPPHKNKLLVSTFLVIGMDGGENLFKIFFLSFFLFFLPFSLSPPPPPAFFKFLGKKYFCRHWWLTRHPKSCFFKFKSPFSFQREKYSSCGIIHPPSRDSRAFPPWLPPRERGCLWSAPLGSPHPSLVSTWSPSQPGRPDWQVPSAPETSAGETRGLP